MRVAAPSTWRARTVLRRPSGSPVPTARRLASSTRPAPSCGSPCGNTVRARKRVTDASAVPRNRRTGGLSCCVLDCSGSCRAGGHCRGSTHFNLWAASSAGRAPRSHRGGREFEPRAVHHSTTNRYRASRSPGGPLPAAAGVSPCPTDWVCRRAIPQERRRADGPRSAARPPSTGPRALERVVRRPGATLLYLAMVSLAVRA